MRILSIVEQSIPPGEDLKVRAISLRIGKLTAIVPKSLRFCMDVVTKDTAAEGAELVFTEVPVELECDECGKVTVLEEPPFKCGSCGSDKVEVIAGREMVVEAIEVEDREESR